MQRPIYMDHNATTPVDERVVEAMLPYFTEHFGNASSRSHAYGWEAEEAVERAREQVASAIGAAEARGVVFTSGATESNNLALKGVAAAYGKKGKHIVTVATEHRAVLDPCKRLQQEGFEVSVLPVDAGGLLDLTLLRDTIRDDTILVSVMAANNEIGTLQPIDEIGALTRERGVLFHCDAVQAVGKVAFDVEAANIDLASFSAHKMYGPKGVGALWIRPRRPRVRVAPEIEGGGQERGLRSGTLNVPGIVGFGQAAQLAAATWQEDAQRIGKLRRRLQDTLFDGIEGLRLNGADDPQRLPGNLNVAFPGTEGEALIGALRDVAVSSGSACSSTSVEPSHVLLALGLSKELAKSSLRFGLGRATTQEDVDFVARRVIEQIRRLRKHAPGGGLSGGALGL